MLKAKCKWDMTNRTHELPEHLQSFHDLFNYTVHPLHSTTVWRVRISHNFKCIFIRKVSNEPLFQNCSFIKILKIKNSN